MHFRFVATDSFVLLFCFDWDLRSMYKWKYTVVCAFYMMEFLFFHLRSAVIEEYVL